MGFAEQNVDLGLAAVALQMSVAYVKGKFLSLCSLHLTEWFYISCKSLAFIQDSRGPPKFTFVLSVLGQQHAF